jgi:hypothetical protein
MQEAKAKQLAKEWHNNFNTVKGATFDWDRDKQCVAYYENWMKKAEKETTNKG